MNLTTTDQQKLTDAMARYHAVRIAIYSRTMSGEREAQIAARFACDAALSDIKRSTRTSGFMGAMAVFEMTIEDCQKALTQLDAPQIPAHLRSNRAHLIAVCREYEEARAHYGSTTTSPRILEKNARFNLYELGGMAATW